MMWQELHAGQRVTARGRAWRVAGTRPWSDCLEVQLAGISSSNDRQELVLLAPFDRLEPLGVAVATPDSTSLMARPSMYLASHGGRGCARSPAKRPLCGPPADSRRRTARRLTCCRGSSSPRWRWHGVRRRAF